MYNLFKQYNKFSNKESLIKKALSSAVGVGQALIPENLEQQITNTINKLSPELALVQTKKVASKFHDYNRLTRLPRAGGAMGEGASTIVSNSLTVRDNVELKVIRRKGEITNFLQDTSEQYIDSAAYETENLLQQHIYDLINYIYYGNASANPYEFDGLDSTIATNRIKATDREGDALTSLAALDNMIDRSDRKNGAGHRRVFCFSPELLSKVSQLLTNVRLNQGVSGSGLTQVEVGGGWRLNAYRDIPIIVTTATSPTNQGTNIYGTLGSSTATTGGTVPDDTYYIQIAAVTDSEQLASAEITQITAGGGTSTLTITWDDIPSAYRYKIYVSDASGGDKVLKRVISADVYDAVGTITGRRTSYTFTTDPVTKDASVSTAQENDIQFEQGSGQAAPEYAFLWDLDSIQGLGKFPYTNKGGAKFGGLVTIEQLARVDDNIPILLKTYGALAPSYEATSVVYRGLRVS